ncbi:MAG: CBS domain-containing protein [Bacteroidota bacterium]
MIAEKLLSETVMPLKTSDTGDKALLLMEEYKVSHLPIVNNEQFLGVISESDLFDANLPDEPVGNHSLSLQKPFVSKGQHIYEVIRTMANLKLSLIPVLDEKNNYLGVITLRGLVTAFSEMGAIQNPGGIIVLELNMNNYSLSQIAQIVESNDAKVLSSYVTSHTDSMKMEVTLKVNVTNIEPILKTFHRYDYIVKASFSEAEYLDDLKDRYDQFMNYLNI